MEKQIDYSKCRECRLFVEDDESLKHPISYCILLGINIGSGSDCSEFLPLKAEVCADEFDGDPVM